MLLRAAVLAALAPSVASLALALPPKAPSGGFRPSSAAFCPAEGYLSNLNGFEESVIRLGEAEVASLAVYKRRRRTTVEILKELNVEHNHYELLGIPSNATYRQVKAAFRKRVVEWRCHPDIQCTPETRTLWDSLQSAHEALSDPERRQAYDRRLRTKAVVKRVIVVAEKAIAFVLSDLMPAAQEIAKQAHKLWKAAQMAAQEWNLDVLAPSIDKLALPDHKELWDNAQKTAKAFNDGTKLALPDHKELWDNAQKTAKAFNDGTKLALPDHKELWDNAQKTAKALNNGNKLALPDRKELWEGAQKTAKALHLLHFVPMQKPRQKADQPD